MRVIELQMMAAARAIVRPQGQMQELVREDEDQLIVSELLREFRIDDQPPGGEHAHRRHARIERDSNGRCQA